MPGWSAPAFAAAAIAVAALVVAAPALSVPLAGVVYAAGSLVCHQLPERSFHLNAYQLPVCARCLGLYGGGALGAVAAILPFGARPAAVSESRRRRYLATTLAALPTAASFTLEWGFGWPMSNEVRAVAAVPLGAAVAFVVGSAVATLH